MTSSFPFTVHRLLFTLPYLLSFIPNPWLKINSKSTVKGKRLMDNGLGGGI